MSNAEYHKNRRAERKKKLLMLLGGRCERCGSRENLHFDHKDPKKKEFNITRNLNGREDVLNAEVKKCRLLCRDCHAAKTRENWEYTHPESEHGTVRRYRGYGCRCDACKKAVSDYYYERLNR